MNTVRQLKKFTKFICKKYKADDTFKRDGELFEVLVKESGVDFGDVNRQMAVMQYLFHKGLVELLNCKDSEHITSDSRIRPTMECLNSKQQRWNYGAAGKEKGLQTKQDIDRFIDTYTRWARF